MKKYFGLDYGTTTSLLYSYDGGKLDGIRSRSSVKVLNGKVVKTGAEACKEPDANGFVESPKRAISNLGGQVNGVTYKEMIEAILFKMVSHESIDLNSHITLTVPNGYDDVKSSNMYQMLGNCLNKKFGPNHSIETYILPEPVAAALFYVHKHLAELPPTSHMVVCDIGGGTTDMCIVRCKKEKGRLYFSVIDGSMQHSSEIGGNKFDDEIGKRVHFPAGVSNIKKKHSCQDLKCKLSIEEEWSIYEGHITLTRSEFEGYIEKHLSELERMMRKMLEKTQLKVDTSWYILPTGGSCKIPAIRQKLEEVFYGAHQTAEDENTIFDSVAQGAAIYSAQRAGILTIEGHNEILIEHRTQNEYQYFTAFGMWQTLIPANLTEGNYPQGNEGNVKLVTNSENVIIKKGKYMVGDIKLREKKANAKLIECKHDKAFHLEGRHPEDIVLQLGVRINKDCLVDRWWLKDCLTGETQEWTMQTAENP